MFAINMLRCYCERSFRFQLISWGIQPTKRLGSQGMFYGIPAILYVSLVAFMASAIACTQVEKQCNTDERGQKTVFDL